MEFIITCGTSQTENIEAQPSNNYLPLDLQAVGYVGLKNFFVQDPVDWVDEEFTKSARASAKAIADVIQRFCGQNNSLEFIGKESNPLGAELSTLVKFFHDNRTALTSHTFYLLRSDTYKGWFNALVLQKVIESSGWGIVVGPYLVEHLRERLPEGGDPLLSLSNRMREILRLIKANQPEQSQPPVIIMSGSFKSVIPCLTVYSLIFALPLIYLFEKSAKIQDLKPVQEIANRSQHNALWQQMSNLNIAQNMVWFQDALDFRTSAVRLPWL